MTLLNHAPCFTAESASQLARQLYGLCSTASPLPSERDQNFLLLAESGEKFVFKIANSTEDRAILEAQQQAMTLVSQQSSFCPRIVTTLTGETIAEVHANNATHFAWLITYLDGVPLGSVRRHSDELLRSLGNCLGKVDRALSGFDHPAIHRDFHWDLANGLREVRKHQSLIADAEVRRLVGKLADDFERETAPLLPGLRRSAIHNDANDYNVLAGGGNDLYSRNQRIVGLVDFGDMVFSYTVANLAIAIAYAILDKADPLAAAAQIVAGYNAEHALTEAEIAALFGLVKLRLCVSVDRKSVV